MVPFLIYLNHLLDVSGQKKASGRYVSMYNTSLT